MLTDIRVLIGELKKNPLATICGLLIACVGGLVMHVVSEQKKHETTTERNQAKIQELTGKILEVERNWAEKLDEVRIQEIGEIKEALKRQTQIEVEQKRLFKKVSK